MQDIQWKKTIAQISLPQKRSVGFFKRKYSLLLTYPVEITRPKSDEEKDILKQHQASFEALKKLFPIVEENSSFALISAPLIPKQEIETDVTFRKILVKDFEVSKEVFEQYENKKTFPLKYNSQQPRMIKH